MSDINKIQIIILAAGHGKRMESSLPKVLVPLHGKPMIKHLLDTVENTKIFKRPILVVGQQRDLVMQTLGNEYKYAIQEEQLGTGHAVSCALDKINEDTEAVIVLYGDHPFIESSTIKKLAQKHTDDKATITMATVVLPDYNEWRNNFYNSFSRIIRDKDGNIIKDVQFRDATEDEKKVTEVNPCYFCFNKKWLYQNLKKLKNDNNQKEYYLTDLVRMAMEEKEKIESIDIMPREALGANSKIELAVLENLTS